MKLKDWLDQNKQEFLESDLRFAVKSIFSRDLSLLTLDSPVLSQHQLAFLNKIKEMYKRKMPLSYILGEEEFFGYKFFVNQNVLVPRPSSEVIVEKAIEIIETNKFNRILDLGCGSGNIAISIAKTLKKRGSYLQDNNEELMIFASDISFKALKVCKVNIETHQVKVKLINTDLFKGFKHHIFDVIVTNPPYVEEEYIENSSSLKYEPKVALAGGRDGLCLIRRILTQAYFYLKREGFILIEIGDNQKDRIEETVASLKVYDVKEWVKDYSGKWRGIILKLNLT